MSKKLKPKFKIQKSEAAKNLEILGNGKVEISKWIVGVGLISVIGVFAIFVGSMVISLSKKPNGLFNESCELRNCEKKLGLSCIEKICQCPKDHFYLDGCQKLSTYNEICRIDQQCIPNQFLICNIISKCDCPLNKYWNEELIMCKDLKKHGEDCKLNECNWNLNLSCYFKKCECIKKKM